MMLPACISYLVYLFLLCLVRISSTKQNYAFQDQKQERYIRSLDNYDFTIPARVTLTGEHISHSLHPYVRRKRNVQEYSQDYNPEHTVHYKVNVHDKSILLKVKPNYKLFLPSLVIERRKNVFNNVSDSVFNHVDGDHHCHFTGEVQGDTSSSVAIEVCNGLTGLLQTSDGVYFIEPVKGYKLLPDNQHPHVIYKRSALPSNLHTQNNQNSCGVKEHLNNKEEKAREKYEKNRKRHRSKRIDRHERHKRSISIEKHIEAMVVVDPDMMEYYKNEDVTTYVLTIMNMVATLFHDASIGNALNFVVVRMMLLEEPQKDLTLTHHADKSLKSFCKWQKSINFKDDDNPNHHDVAILLTRINICARMNEPCSTLGLAQISGICQPHRSCNINEDTGLPLAYTVAHELGHNFGMKHDGIHNNCEMKENEDFLYVMTSQLLAVNVPMKWSECSRRDITKFIDRGWAYCLDDEPVEHRHQKFKYPVIPPGTMYDADHQCRLVYGPEAELCDGIQEGICNTLWCRYKNKCTTKLESAAEGTICGTNKWCFNGDCVEIGERPQAINGNWGEWSSWSECTRTCGAGVSIVERHCDNPQPLNGGKYCIGERKRYRICNTDTCPEEENSKSFRELQCAEFNVIPYKKRLYHWEPVPIRGAPCQLHCKPRNRFFSVMLKDMVTDGTPCTPGTRNMCISGRCRHVGCDWNIDSSAKEDKCGVCHGDGSTCETIKDQFNETQGVGYVEATVIPKEARNIHIEEVADANNYIAVCNSRGEYLLNGHWFIQWSGDYDMAGTVAHYQRDGNKESVTAMGPLKEPLHIMLLLQTVNPGVSFEYTVPKENITELRTPEFSWRYMDWTHCTSSCGGGTQRSGVICEEIEAGVVEDVYCNSTLRPNDKQRSCNMHLCPAKWWTGSWQHCSVTCGSGGVHRRTVICVRSLGQDEQIALEDKACEGQVKPIEVEPCHRKKPCIQHSRWTTGEWTQCTGNPCDIQRRRVTCDDLSVGCVISERPESNRPCSNVTCGTWEFSDWSECTRSCDVGLAIRKVACVGSHVCDPDLKPSAHMNCNTQECPVTTTMKVETTTTTTTTSTTTVAPTTTTTTTTKITNPTTTTVSTSQTTENVVLKTNSPRQETIVRQLPGFFNHDHAPTASSTETKDADISSEGMINEQDETSESTSEEHTTESSEETTNIDTSTEDTRDKNTPRKDAHIILDNNKFHTMAPDSNLNININVKGSTIGGRDETVDVKNKESVEMFTVIEGGLEDEDEESNEDEEDGISDNNEDESLTKSELETSREKNVDENPYHRNLKVERPEIPTSSNTNKQKTPKGNGEPTTTRNRTENQPNISHHRHRHHHMTRGYNSDSIAFPKSLGMPSNKKLSMPKLEDLGLGRVSLSGEPNIPTPPKMKAPLHPPHRGLLKSRTSPQFRWTTSNWAECSRLCGGGIKTRSVSCIDSKTKEEIPDMQCDIIRKPNAIERCNIEPCNEWDTTAWTECSTSCGEGVRRREVTCPDLTICDNDKKPADIEKCDLPLCLAWMHGQWSSCPVTCGGGEQQRLVQCVNLTSQQASFGCPDDLKPSQQQKCNTDACPENKYALNRQRCVRDIMNHQICRALKNMRQCSKLYVRVKCCRTCNIDKWRKRGQRRRVAR